LLLKLASAAVLGLSTVLVAGHPHSAQESRPAQSSQAPAPKSIDAKDAIRAAVDQLASEIRRHPAEPSKAADRVAGLYLIEIATGEVTLVADQTDPRVTFCGSPAWSNDGKRILFDAMRTTEVQLARIKAIEVVAGKLTQTDLGVGNCPTASPTGDRVAFLLNSGGVPGAAPGVWLMQADGSRRRELGSYGRPKWSPDSRQFMIIGFATPAPVTLMDVRPEKSGPLQIPNLQIFSIPSWASEGTIVAVIGSNSGDTIALLDVTDPSNGRVTDILWSSKAKGLGIQPTYPAYCTQTGRGVFIGSGKDGMALYSFERGAASPPKRLEVEGNDSLMQDVALSPDGRYALFSSNRAGPRHRGSPPAAGTPRPKQPTAKNR
jgi:Tol biopolymer transport system component